MSRLPIILTQIRGSLPFVIPLLLAGFVIFLMLAFGTESPKYSMTVDEFLTGQIKDNQAVRLDGVIKEIQIKDDIRDVQLCHEQACIQAHIPSHIQIVIQVQDNVIFSGKYHHDVLEVQQVLKRCH